MLENPSSAAAAAADPLAVVKRYAPPNQRNRALDRRKSSDRFDRTNNLHGNDFGKNQIASSKGWAAAMHCFNDSSIDLSERPVMYSGSGSAWGHFRLPHQLMAPAGGAGSLGSSMDFLSELRRLKHNSNQCAVAQLIMAVGHIFIAFGWPGAIHIATILIGLGYGAHWAIVPAAASELFGLKKFGAL